MYNLSLKPLWELNKSHVLNEFVVTASNTIDACVKFLGSMVRLFISASSLVAENTEHFITT
jgi:hypothetical protein